MEKKPFKNIFLYITFGLVVSLLQAQKSYDYPFQNPKIATEINSTTWQTRWDACQNGLANVRKALIDADPDVLVVFAADLAALFLDDDMAAVAVFTDDTIVNVPRPMTADTPPSNVAAAWAHGWGDGAIDKPYPVASDLARHLLEQLTSENFDAIPANYLDGKSGMGVQMAFAYNRIMGDKVLPVVPVFQSPFVPKGNVAPKSSYDLGQAVRRAIESSASDGRVAVLGIGGLSHFIVNEPLDRSIIKAITGIRKTFNSTLATAWLGADLRSNINGTHQHASMRRCPVAIRQAVSTPMEHLMRICDVTNPKA